MEVLNNKEINNTTGRHFLSDEDENFNAKLIYVSGISGFDKILNDKTQNEISAVIHLIKYKKGLMIRLAKNFKKYETAISLSDIKIIALENQSEFFLLHINTSNDKINFCCKNSHKDEMLKFISSLAIKPIIIQANRDSEYYNQIKKKYLR
ncbi:MAG: hypothetical protein M0R21_02465 [Lentimicrobiaceae bacterium]|nr:hypothetical protein [Lentimicrobiaceae bacterium]